MIAAIPTDLVARRCAPAPLGSPGGFFVTWIVEDSFVPNIWAEKTLTKNLAHRFVIASAK
jgi:hypothetical protein